MRAAVLLSPPASYISPTAIIPPGCASLGCGCTPSSGVRGFSRRRRPAPCPALPLPVCPRRATATQHECACQILSRGLDRPTGNRLAVALRDHFIFPNAGLAQALGCFQLLGDPGPADLPWLGRSWAPGPLG